MAKLIPDTIFDENKVHFKSHVPFNYSKGPIIPLKQYNLNPKREDYKVGSFCLASDEDDNENWKSGYIIGVSEVLDVLLFSVKLIHEIGKCIVTKKVAKTFKDTQK